MSDWIKDSTTDHLRQIHAARGDGTPEGRAAKAEIHRRETEQARQESARKEAVESQRHQEWISLQKSQPNQNTDEKWYKKPPGIILIGVVVAVLAAIAKYLL